MMILGWVLTLQMRIIPPVLDPILVKIVDYPGYSICLQSHKK